MTEAMFQRWENLLFAHWRVEPAAIASRIPRGLTLDLREGAARSRTGAAAARRGAAEFLADYGPIGEPFRAAPGSLEEWLTGRYRLYAQSGGTLYRAEIHHEPWALQRARAEIVRNTMPRASGIELPADSPLLHFSRALDVRVGWPEKV